MQQGESATPQTIKISGREFTMTGEQLTAAQENFMQGNLRAAGVTDILADPKATLETHGEQILTALLLSGRDVWVIAAMLVEPGKRWRYEDACKNADLFADATDRQSKLILQNILFGCVTGFFGQEGKSLLTSLTFSAPAKTDAPTPGNNGVSAAQETLVSSES